MSDDARGRGPFHMFNVTMRHDDGTIVIATAAPTAEDAARIVCIAEGAPARSVVSVERQENGE